MATGTITKRAVEAISAAQPGKRNYLWDDTLKGFGIMVTDKGVRSYLVQYRIGGRGAPTRRFTIGRHGSPWTPASARDRAAEVLESVRRKIDPLDAQREALASSKLAAQAKALAEVEHAALQFSAIADAYISKARTTLRRASEQVAIIDRDLRPAFGDRIITQVSADDISDRLGEISERSSSAALKAYVALRAIFSFAHERHRKLFPKSLSPFGNVSRPAGARTRTRYLTDAEVRLMWIAQDRIGWPFGPIYRLLMLTALRLREVAEGRWSEIDFAERRWNIPGSRTKNGVDHWVHLSPLALDVLATIPRETNLGQNADFIFTTNRGKTPVSGFSRAKSRLGAAMLSIAREEAAATGADPNDAQIAPFIVHDLRRTIARGCQRFGTAPEVTERMLNHLSEVESGLKGTYQVYKYEPERIAATERWASEITYLLANCSKNTTLIGGNAANPNRQ